MSDNADPYQTAVTSPSEYYWEGLSVRSVSRFRLGAKALVTDGEKVLLIKEQRDDGSTFWTLPGGGTQLGESMADCLRREIAEELQCQCLIDQPVDMCTYRHLTDHEVMSVYLLFSCEFIGDPQPALSEGVVNARWLSPHDLPSTTLPPFRRVLRRAAPVGDNERLDS